MGAGGDPVFDPLLTIDQIAQWLGKPKGTLYQWRSRSMDPRGIKVGNDLRCPAQRGAPIRSRWRRCGSTQAVGATNLAASVLTPSANTYSDAAA